MPVKTKARKEALFMRVTAPDQTVEFHEVTSFVGKPSPFKNPKATLAMRVTDVSISFSLLHLTKKSATGLAGKSIDFPHGPLMKIERIGLENLDLPDNTLEVLVNNETYKYVVEKDVNGVVTLEGEDGAVDLPKGVMQVTLKLKTPVIARPVFIGFIGHLGKPGSTETVRRIASMILFSITQLLQFRVITEFETVRVPAAPRSIARPTRKPGERANIAFPVWLFDEKATQLVASGEVICEIDLDQANPSTGRLLLNLTPSKDLENFFEEYRNSVDLAVTQKLRGYLGDDEMKMITVDIVMGEVSAGTIERLKSALESALQGFDVTPNQFRDHS
jgi:hypothetical protein